MISCPCGMIVDVLPECRLRDVRCPVIWKRYGEWKRSYIFLDQYGAEIRGAG